MTNNDSNQTCCEHNNMNSSDERKPSHNMQEFGNKAAETLAVLLYKLQDSKEGKDDLLYQFARKAKESLEQLQASLKTGGFGGMGKKIAFISNAGQALQKVLEGMNQNDENKTQDVHEFSNKAEQALDKLIASFADALQGACQDANTEQGQTLCTGNQQNENKQGAIHGNAEISKH